MSEPTPPFSDRRGGRKRKASARALGNLNAVQSHPPPIPPLAPRQPLIQTLRFSPPRSISTGLLVKMDLFGDLIDEPGHLETESAFKAFLNSSSAYSLCNIGSRCIAVNMLRVSELRWNSQKETTPWLKIGNLKGQAAVAHALMYEQLLTAFNTSLTYNKLVDEAKEDYESICKLPIVDISKEVSTFNMCLCYFALFCVTMQCQSWPSRSAYFERYCVPILVIPGRDFKLSNFVGLYVCNTILITLPVSFSAMVQNFSADEVAATLRRVHSDLTPDMFSPGNYTTSFAFFPPLTINVLGLGDIKVKGFVTGHSLVSSNKFSRAQSLQVSALEKNANIPLPLYVKDQAASGPSHILRQLVRACRTDEEKMQVIGWALSPDYLCKIFNYEVTKKLVGGAFSVIIKGADGKAKVCITTTRLFLSPAYDNDLTPENQAEIDRRSELSFDPNVPRGSAGDPLNGSRSDLSSEEDLKNRKQMMSKATASLLLTLQALQDAANLKNHSSVKFLSPTGIPPEVSLINQTDKFNKYKLEDFQKSVEKKVESLEAEMNDGVGKRDKNGNPLFVSEVGGPVLDTAEVSLALRLLSEMFGIEAERIRVLGDMASCQHCTITLEGSGIGVRKQKSVKKWDQLGLTRLGATVGSVFRTLTWVEGKGDDDDGE